MKKNFKVIQLNGIAELILAIAFVIFILGVVICLPVYGIKFLWNSFLNGYFDVPTVRLSQASLLWFAIVAVIYAQIRKKIRLKFVNVSNMSDTQINTMDYEQFLKEIKKEEQEKNEKINH